MGLMLKPMAAAEARCLRDFFERIGFTDDSLRGDPRRRELPSPRAGNLPYLLDCTSEPSAFNIALRLFLYAIAMERGVVQAAFEPGIVDILIRSGLVREEHGTLTPVAMLNPCEEYLFASDPVTRMNAADGGDIVLWPNQTTRIVEMASVRTPSGTTLDLGTGCGVLAVLAAKYSDRVLATDLNPRAAEFVAFNAALNETTNIEYREGDTFAPLGDMTFDRILANPPFFVTPSSDVLYCENSMELDQYCRRVVREGAAHLNDNGILQMTFEWVQVRGQSWQTRVAEWMHGTGCDAWIVRSNFHEPAAYAYERTRDVYAASPESGTARYRALVDYYREREVELVCGGMLTLRRRAGTNWLRIDECPLQPGAPFGKSILDCLHTQTWLAANPGDAGLDSLRPKLVPGTRLEQQFRAGDGAWAASSVRVMLGGALPAALAMEADVAQFVARCDGRHSLRELAAGLASEAGVDASIVYPQCVAVVRRLAERRLITF